MKVGRFPWTFRTDRTLDPKHLNENFRKSADYIRDTLELQYSYSIMRMDLTGLDLSDPSEHRRFLFMPPAKAEIVGAELACRGLTGEQNVYARWMSQADAVDPAQVSALDNAPPSPVNIILPSGGPDESWRYVEIKHQSDRPVDKNINQRHLGLDLDPPLGIYLIEIGTDSEGVSIPTSLDGELNIWFRFRRDVDAKFGLPDMFNGAMSADADVFNDVKAELEAKRAEATDATKRVYRCESYVAKDFSTAAPDGLAFQRLFARWPSINTDSGSDWVLHSYHIAFVSSGSNFNGNDPINARVFDTGLTKDVGGTLKIGAAETRLDGLGYPVGVSTLYRIVGPPQPSDPVGSPLPASMADTDGASTSPMESSDDWYFNAGDNLLGAAVPIKMAYVYLWFTNGS